MYTICILYDKGGIWGVFDTVLSLPYTLLSQPWKGCQLP